MPNLSFFVGKGGVGKTTVSAAYAVYRASQHARHPVLLMSTDPAHSLADIFEIRLGSKPQRVAASGLTIWQVDAQRQFHKFLDRNRRPIVSLLESGTMFTRAEIEPLLDTALPGMAEMAALLAIHETLAAGSFGEIVVDTAPIGHTLRLFAIPEYFARFLDLLEIAGSRDQVLAQHFGGSEGADNPFIAEWRMMVEAVQQALHQAESRVIMVTTPEKFALNESLRTAQAMAAAPDPLQVTSVVINRAVRRAGKCSVCREREKRTRAALQFVKRHFPRLPLHLAEDRSGPVLGLSRLHDFGAHVFGRKPLRLAATPPTAAREVKLASAEWPALQTSVTWTTGKGGVGKTTISAGLAVSQRRHFRSRAVVVCSTDPSPSLDDVFQKNVGDLLVSVLGDPRLHAVEVDAAAEFRVWADEMKSQINDALTSDVFGMHVDLSLERRILIALLDMVPPGVDEITAIFRILDMLGDGAPRRSTRAGADPWLIIDMAPTGHALELLRMPERILLWSRLLLKSLAPHRKMALAREAAVQIATLSHRVRELAGLLKDSQRSQVVPVMLAEPLPDRETSRLLHSLDELGVPISALFVNRVLFRQRLGSCRRCGHARQWQMATLSELRRRYPGKKIYVVRDRGREIAGAGALNSFIGELWQIV